MKITCSVQKAAFDRKLARAAAKMGGMTQDMVKKGVEFFTQSAVKDTPQSKHKKRVMRTFKAINHKRVDFYLVKWRRPGASGHSRKGSWAFSGRDKPGAMRHLPITYRGIGKAAWLFSAQRIGINPPTAFKPSAAVRGQSGAICSGVMSRGFAFSTATVVNRARGISRYGERAAAWALGKAGNRMLGWARAEARRVA